MGFTNGTNYEEMYVLTSAVTKNTYTTEAAFTGVVGTNTVCRIPANYLGGTRPNPVSTTMRAEIQGTIANTAGATFAVNLGLDTAAGTKANPVTVYAATAPTASITTLWHCHVDYTVTAFATSTFSVQVNGFWNQSATASGAALGTAGLRTDFQALLTGIDPRVDLYVELFGTWSVSNAANTTTVQQFRFYGEN